MARPAQPLDPQRRARLLSRARLVFAAEGFRAARLTSILKRADFPRSSFYYFFATKERLLDAAVADGLRELAGLVRVPAAADLDESSFWPSLTGLAADISAAARRPDLVAVGTVYHLDDLPPCPSLDAFKEAVVAWSTGIVARGLELGLLDPLIPAQMHAELAYAVAGCIDRWATRDAAHLEVAQDLACTILPRMLGAPGSAPGPAPGAPPPTSRQKKMQKKEQKKQDRS